MSSDVNHPAHYGGEDNPYEVIKVLRAWDLELARGFCWGNLIKYTARAGKKGASVVDRSKAEWYATELVSIEAELAGRPKKGPNEIPIVMPGPGQYKLHIDWEKRTYVLSRTDIGGGGGPYQAQGGASGNAGKSNYYTGGGGGGGGISHAYGGHDHIGAGCHPKCPGWAIP